MPMSIGVNLRVTGHCNQGGRKYMEDTFSVAYQQSSNDREIEYAFFGIFDGHGGGEAATFAKENLMDIIVKQKNFWSDNDEDVLKAIRDGYINTHYAMWRELGKSIQYFFRFSSKREVNKNHISCVHQRVFLFVNSNVIIIFFDEYTEVISIPRNFPELNPHHIDVAPKTFYCIRAYTCTVHTRILDSSFSLHIHPF